MDIKINKSQYQNKTILENISLKIDNKGLFGFFGKNGAGKTTFLKCIAGLKSFEGEIKLNDHKLESKDIAWIPSEPNFYEYLTGEEFYNFYNKISNRHSYDESKYLFEIDNKKIIKENSTGNKKKVYINAILQFNDYKVYIFDEPFNGLDLESNYILLEKIKDLAKQHIVLISSHIIEIIEPYLNSSFIVKNNTIYNSENISSYFKLR